MRGISAVHTLHLLPSVVLQNVIDGARRARTNGSFFQEHCVIEAVNSTCVPCTIRFYGGEKAHRHSAASIVVVIVAERLGKHVTIIYQCFVDFWDSQSDLPWRR